jgi:hypothetical protein
LCWCVDVGSVSGVRVVDSVAVPPPEPHWVGLERPVAEHCFGECALVGIEHEPE